MKRSTTNASDIFRAVMTALFITAATLASPRPTPDQIYIIDNISQRGSDSDATSANNSSLPGPLKFELHSSFDNLTRDTFAFKGRFKRAQPNTRPLSLTGIAFDYADRNGVARPYRRIEETPLYTRLTINNIVGRQEFHGTGFYWEVLCQVVLTKGKTPGSRDTIQIKVLQVLDPWRGGPNKPRAVHSEPYLIDAIVTSPSRLVLDRN